MYELLLKHYTLVSGTAVVFIALLTIFHVTDNSDVHFKLLPLC